MKLTNFLIAMLISFFLSSQSFAFTCYMTLIKDTCWKDYDVSVDVLDVVKDKKSFTIQAKRGKAWERVKFECEPKQTFNYFATYSPAFWEEDKGKVFKAKRFWSLPVSVDEKVSAWNVSLCYPQDFAEVPLPPTASNKCVCDRSVAPKIEE